MHKTPARDDRLDTSDPLVLVAILIAARRAGDRLLETVARRELEQRHGIRIRFARELRARAASAPPPVRMSQDAQDADAARRRRDPTHRQEDAPCRD